MATINERLTELEKVIDAIAKAPDPRAEPFDGFGDPITELYTDASRDPELVKHARKAVKAYRKYRRAKRDS